MKSRYLMAAIAWEAIGLLGAGFSNASFRADTPDLHHDPREARATLAFCLTMGAVAGPFTLPAVAAISGFGQDGWTLSGSPVEEAWR